MGNEKLRDDMTDKLFKAILSLKNTDECYSFFEDICTITEIKDMAQRLEVAGLLCDGKKYSYVSEKTGASPATISRVSRCLNYGADGYKLVLDRISGEEQTKKE